MSAPTTRRRYRGATPEERDAERRRRLLDAATELFGTAGWNRTSIESLCRKANVTTRHFYALFDGRDDLFLALYDELITSLARGVAENVSQAPEEPEARARAAFAAVADLYRSDPRIPRILLVEVFGISERVEAHRRAAIEGFADQVATWTSDLIAKGVLPNPPRDPRLTAVALVGAATELVGQHLGTAPDTPSLEAVVDEMVRLYLLAFGAQAPT